MATEHKVNAYRTHEKATVPHFGVSSFPCIRDLDKDRDSLFTSVKNGQSLAGSGALVFEGELLEIPIWN